MPLEDEYMLVYHDYRGSGRSEVVPSATYTYGRVADDVDELRVHLGHERVGELAHCMGGFIGLKNCLRHPEACAGMVLVGTTPTGNPPQDRWTGAACSRSDSHGQGSCSGCVVRSRLVLAL